MRRARWLILAAISIIVLAVGSTYYERLVRMRKDAPSSPQPLKAGIGATAEGWHYRKADATLRGPDGQPCPVIEVSARQFAQLDAPSVLELQGVELHLFHDCGATYDRIKSAKASFDTASGELYSEGEVEITRGVRPDDKPSARLLQIVSSGVHFETKTGKAYTDQPASFTFENGSGKAVGADYDPRNHQLHMKSAVELNWNGRDPKAAPMKVETGDLVYFEEEGKVALSPWARMTRGTTHVEGGKSWVTLEEGEIRLVESEDAHGVQEEPARKVEYAAAHLMMQFNDDGQVSQVTGDRNAKLTSTSPTGRTDVQADRVELTMAANQESSVLERALALGHAVVDSNPKPKPGSPPPATRVLKSESIELHMRAGGQEIDNVETHSPGSLDFIPNTPDQPKRNLTGDRFWIAYGADNQIQSFRSVKVQTRTENPPKKGKPSPPVLTSSGELKAEFDPKTNQVARLEQNKDFRYQEGDRKAQADRATLDQKTSIITLTGGARVSDPTGSTTGDRIVLNQNTSDFTAEGHVTSTRMPDQKGNSSAMLSNSEPMQAKANRMVSTDDNLKIRYEGNAVAWQGPNRIQADRLDIDRDDEVMKATGSVISQFVDKDKKDKDGKPIPRQQTVYTIVKAPQMTYVEEDRVAHYQGGTTLIRPNMTVKAREIKAFLKDADSDSSLDHAVADGNVVVVQTTPGRTRTGTSEHAEYYAAEDKMVMTGGKPQFVDSVKGTTKGDELIYYASKDRLLVNGVESQRAESTIHRK